MRRYCARDKESVGLSHMECEVATVAAKTLTATKSKRPAPSAASRSSRCHASTYTPSRPDRHERVMHFSGLCGLCRLVGALLRFHRHARRAANTIILVPFGASSMENAFSQISGYLGDDTPTSNALYRSGCLDALHVKSACLPR
jgi:hypothetical protein